MLALERSNIHTLVAGRGTQEPILEQKNLAPILDEITAGQGITFNLAQRTALETILSSRDPVLGLQGLAGSGKTTTLATLTTAAQRQGYVVEGFAPTAIKARPLVLRPNGAVRLNPRMRHAKRHGRQDSNFR